MIDIDAMQAGYPRIVREVLRSGRFVAPRGQKTLEVPDMLIRLTDPRNALPMHTGRKLNKAIAAVETVQLIGGFSDPALMLRVSSEFEKFLEPDTQQFWGGYGRRIGPQLILAAQKLTQDRDTRQAVITLWDPRKDNVSGKRDYPCTLSFVFQIRNDKLELHVTMRSNDVWLGLPYDVFQFTQLQLTLAGALNIEPGAYFHHSVSMHLYERDLMKAEALHPPTDVWTGPAGFSGATIFNRVRRARAIGEGKAVRNPTASDRWYMDTLEPYMEVA